MPGHGTRVDGRYGAHATSGGDLLARELDRLAAEGGVKSLHAKVSYLTNSVAGQEAMVEAGIDLSTAGKREKVLNWLADEELNPPVGITYANAQRVEEAYAARRRETMAGRLRARLARGGGAFVAVAPPDQSAVDPRHRRSVEDLARAETRIRVIDSTWSAIVDRWSAGDTGGLQLVWEDICDEQLYPPAAFYSCSGIRVIA